jgi:hypothetical protein
MANPWSSSAEDVALQPLRRFLDSDQRITSVAVAEEKLNDDPNDMVTRLRLADQKTLEYYDNGGTLSHTGLKPETILAYDLAKELTVQLTIIQSYLLHFDEHDSLKIALLNAIKACSAHKEELSVVNRAKLIECIRNAMELIPRIYKKANKVPPQEHTDALNKALEVMQSNGVVSQEDLYGYIRSCTLLLSMLLEH